MTIKQYNFVDITEEEKSTDIFTNIIEFGVQSIPGIQFYINDDYSKKDKKFLITLGHTGIYNFRANEENKTPITKITFLKSDLKVPYLLVDVIGEQGVKSE